jgi:RND superfamily putative drug exporter
MFGSVLVPIKAMLLNILSLTATFGAMVWVFQNGHLHGLLNFTPTGLTDTSEPILMFCIAFGLSMDYEVFLLSRIKEEYDRTGDNEASVARGLARTGRIVTAAAVLLSVTFFAFATSDVTFIKMFGVGLGMAVLVDAFVIRATLVPALMKLAGRANWWAPRPLAALYRRFGISEEPAAAMERWASYGPAVAAGDGNGNGHARGAAPGEVAQQNGHPDPELVGPSNTHLQ